MPGLVLTDPYDESPYLTNALLPATYVSTRRDTLASPLVNRIPAEILCEIFVYRHQDDNSEIWKPPHFPITPLILSQVCSHWKDIILSFPTLWSSIRVHYPRPRHVPMVKLWLDRSGTCPLSLTLGHYPEIIPGQHALTDEILSLFILHVSRWREITFRFYESVQRPLLTIPAGAAKCLESAVLDLRSFGRDSADKIWHAIHASPLLCRANWLRSYGSIGMPAHIPWQRLTHIALHPRLTVEELLSILRLCGKVQALEVYSLSTSSIPSAQAPLVVPTLHTMVICARPHSAPLLDHLILPSLHSLSIRHHGYPVPHNPQSLHDLLVRSSCNLKKLTFEDGEVPEEDLLLFLKSDRLVSLIELNISPQIMDATINSLTRRFVDGKEEFLLPNLEIISLKMCITSDGTVATMVASRFTPNAPLRAVTLRLWGASSVCDFASLKRMKEAGLIMDVFSRNSNPDT